MPSATRRGPSHATCSATADCTAVGTTRSGTAPLIERWNGTKWSRQSTENIFQSSALNGVSCSADNSCTLVGAEIDANNSAIAPLAAAWNGKTWTQETLPSVPAGDTAALSGVACVSPSSCEAVGDTGTQGGNSSTLAEYWNGATWVATSPPAPAGESTAALNAISCRAAGACETVGAAGNLAIADGQASIGQPWSAQPSVVVAAPVPANYTRVSCPTASYCMAVGTSGFFLAGQTPSVELWNGSTWAPVTPAFPDATLNDLSVSCSALDACTVIGDRTGGAPVAERWDGSSWTAQNLPPPNGATAVQVDSVSCTTAYSCIAVGSALYSGTSPITTIWSWDGTAWNVGTTSVLLGGPLALSCASDVNCMAVGLAVDATGKTSVVAEHSTGHAWKARSLALPTSTNYIGVASVSCPQVTYCLATWTYQTTPSSVPRNHTAVAIWDGRTWARGPKLPTNFVARSVSCASTSSCVAVGNGTAVFNGSTWSFVPAPDIGLNSYGSLNSVSCTSTAVCGAVGFQSIDSEQTFLAEQYVPTN